MKNIHFFIPRFICNFFSFQKVTFTPRLLIADLKGTLGYLSEEGNLSEVTEEDNTEQPEVLWEENRLEITKEPCATKSSFVKSLEQTDNSKEDIKFDFDNETNKWVDYLIPRFHPRSINVVTDYEHGSTTQPFDIFPVGQNLWNTKKFSEDFVDKIRAYTEECDFMQGFQVIFLE